VIIHISYVDEFSITDANGRHWRFSWHPYCGPSVLRKDGQDWKRNPGQLSPFWPALEAWLKTEEGQKASKIGPNELAV